MTYKVDLEEEGNFEITPIKRDNDILFLPSKYYNITNELMVISIEDAKELIKALNLAINDLTQE